MSTCVSHPGARVDPGCGAGTPGDRGVTPPSAGATVAARGGGTGAVPGGDTRPDSARVTRAPHPAHSKGCGSLRQNWRYFIPEKKAQIELMRERRQTRSRAEIPNGRKINDTNKEEMV